MHVEMQMVTGALAGIIGDADKGAPHANGPGTRTNRVGRGCNADPFVKVIGMRWNDQTQQKYGKDYAPITFFIAHNSPIFDHKL